MEKQTGHTLAEIQTYGSYFSLAYRCKTAVIWDSTLQSYLVFFF